MGDARERERRKAIPECCATCKFFRVHGESEAACHRRAPIGQAIPSQAVGMIQTADQSAGLAKISFFPPIEPTMWCGEYQLNPEIKEPPAFLVPDEGTLPEAS